MTAQTVHLCVGDGRRIARKYAVDEFLLDEGIGYHDVYLTAVNLRNRFYL